MESTWDLILLPIYVSDMFDCSSIWIELWCRDTMTAFHQPRLHYTLNLLSSFPCISPSSLWAPWWWSGPAMTQSTPTFLPLFLWAPWLRCCPTVVPPISISAPWGCGLDGSPSGAGTGMLSSLSLSVSHTHTHTHTHTLLLSSSDSSGLSGAALERRCSMLGTWEADDTGARPEC